MFIQYLEGVNSIDFEVYILRIRVPETYLPEEKTSADVLVANIIRSIQPWGSMLRSSQRAFAEKPKADIDLQLWRAIL